MTGIVFLIYSRRSAFPDHLFSFKFEFVYGYQAGFGSRNRPFHQNQIIIIDGGHIIASGTHQELLQSNPIYQDICRSQFGAEALEMLSQ